MKYFVPGALLFLSLVVYAPLAPWLGFYWDDWPAVWFYHSLGAGGFQEVFAIDRPLLAWLFSATTPIFRDSTLLWQTFAILTRWLSAVSFWWFLTILFPTWKKLAASAAVLFLVYPGFNQQFVSVTYSHAFVLYTLFIVSLALMVIAARNLSRNWPLYILSIMLSIFGIFSVEYYFGLELLRPIILWMVFSEQFDEIRGRIKRTLLYWSPYLAAISAFLVYTIRFKETPRGQVQIFDILLSNPLSGAFYIVTTISRDLFETSLLSWIKTIDLRNILDLYPGFIFLYFLIGLASAGVTYYLIARVEDPASVENKRRISGPLQFLLLGGLALLLGGWPFWATDLQLKLRFPLDRFTLPMIFGASLAAVGLIFLIVKSNRGRGLILALLVGLSAGFHFATGLSYIQEWDMQKAFFYQLTWRAPGITPSTILLTPELPFTYYSDNSLTAPLNWTYDPQDHSSNLSYLMLDLESRLGNEIVSFNPQTQVEHNYRAKNFLGTLSDTLIFFYNPPRCLVVYDPEFETTFPQSDYLRLEALKLSNPDRIILDAQIPAQPPAHIFSPARENSWCYYFENADLARQRADWAAVVELGDQAQGLFEGLKAENIIELLPFIEGYARSGSLENAFTLSRKTLLTAPDSQLALCKTWDRIQEETNLTEDARGSIEDHYRELQCKSQ